ncbi:TasA family protein [Ruminococcus intestinalis]|uniref:TasA family protein n=1 Tax=Ruminococcus intestinalis TaxID=2763066 RepID=UPI0025CDDC42|nr:TasA family protein [uncultured Ruminococcus sp.]
MKVSKKNIAITGVAVSLAAVMLIGGGTFAYLKGETDPITNSFRTNQVQVSLEETTGNEYNIIPGTTQRKDPKVTVNNTVDAYVFVEITDETDNLVDYAIADGWMPVDGVPNVYYRLVSAIQDIKEFSVLKNDEVRYSKALENDDMTDGSGSLKRDINLTFNAVAIQAEPFANAEEAYKAKDSIITSDTDVIEAAIMDGMPVVLSADAKVDSAALDRAGADIDLNGQELKIGGTTPIVLNSSKSISLKDGTLVLENQNSRRVGIAICEGGNLELNDVNMTATDVSMVVDKGTNKATVDIIDSVITSTDNYILSTNAGNPETGANVVINIKNSTLIAQNSDSTAVLMNVPGTLNIEDSRLEANRQGLIVRCGNATVNNSTVKSNVTTDVIQQNSWDYYDNNKWGSGNEVPVAAVVVGNRGAEGAISYPHDATLTSINSSFITASNRPVYAAGYNGHTATINGIDSADVIQSTGFGGNVVINS